ncbi:MAG: bifunctional diguanylate cyclase/phosphodiesterase [Firmicutes bacterium]|nr:bifunctional diguanylate cyclase/phosphodiesterase [Bacillota bacterium]
MKDRIKKYLGFEKLTQYEKNYIDDTNTMAGIYMSVVVIVLETWMLLRLGFVARDGSRSAEWIAGHFAAYAALWTTALVTLIYSVRFLKKKTQNRLEGRFLRMVFGTICVLFGMYISQHDYARGEQILTFLTMLVFVACLYAWRPWSAFLMLTFSYGLFYLMLDGRVPLGSLMPESRASDATRINLFIMWISVFMVSVSIYFQRLTEARKTEKLEQANSELGRIAKTDELTGLDNKRWFAKKAAKIQKELSVPTYIYINISNFKSYNEKYGYEAGNGLLKSFAEDVLSTFPDSFCAHFDGDRFVILTEEIDIREKINTLDAHLRMIDSGVKLGVRAGIYCAAGKDISPEAASDNARHACDSLKKTDRLCQNYDDKMELEQRRRRYIVNNIDKAVENGYIKAYYQPVVWTKDKTLCGIEALARWDDPEFGFMNPGMFVPVLEEYNLIHKLDAAVLDIACADIQKAKKEGRPLLPVSVNFSRLDFELMNVPDMLENSVKKYGVDKKLIHVEITESAITDREDMLGSIISKLRSSGYRLWLDDFGSGYSSLNVLKDFNFDVLKLDMKFLSSLGTNSKSAIIIDSILKMAEQIGMHTLSEGVETGDEADFLENIGCERLQGFLIGRPMPVEELYKKIENGEYTVSKEFINA